MTVKNKHSVAPFYWDNFCDTSMGRYLFRLEHGFISQILDPATQPYRLLEVGCGSGRITMPLHQAGQNVLGLDMDLAALAAFRQRSHAIPIVRGDTLHLPFSDSSFDCLAAIQCLGYFDYHQFLRECNRVLCNHGLLIFQAVNRRNYKRMLRRVSGRAANIEPSYNLSYDEMLEATIKYGFNIEAVSGYNWVPFDRYSDSVLVDAAALVEHMLRLDRYYSISPWILMAARKRNL